MFYFDSVFVIVITSLFIGALVTGLLAFLKTHQLQLEHHIQLQLLHNLPVGLFYEKQGIINLNKTLCLMWNIAHKPHSFEQFLLLIDKTEQKRFLDYYLALCEKKQPFDALMKRGKQMFHVRGRVFEKDTRIVWFYDLSTTQEQLDNLNTKTQLLTQQRELLQSALEALPLPIFIHQGQENIIFANNSANQNDRDLSQLHWASVPFQNAQQNYTLTFGQETRTEEEVQSMFREVAAAHQRLCQKLPCAICLFNAKGQLMACSEAFAHLWNLDTKWLQSPQNYESFWDTLQEKGLLTRVANFAQHKKQQTEHFARLSETEELFLYLPDGRIVRRLMIPFAQGGVILLDEDKTV